MKRDDHLTAKDTTAGPHVPPSPDSREGADLDRAELWPAAAAAPDCERTEGGGTPRQWNAPGIDNRWRARHFFSYSQSLGNRLLLPRARATERGLRAQRVRVDDLTRAAPFLLCTFDCVGQKTRSPLSAVVRNESVSLCRPG